MVFRSCSKEGSQMVYCQSGEYLMETFLTPIDTVLWGRSSLRPHWWDDRGVPEEGHTPVQSYSLWRSRSRAATTMSRRGAAPALSVGFVTGATPQLVQAGSILGSGGVPSNAGSLTVAGRPLPAGVQVGRTTSCVWRQRVLLSLRGSGERVWGGDRGGAPRTRRRGGTRRRGRPRRREGRGGGGAARYEGAPRPGRARPVRVHVPAPDR